MSCGESRAVLFLPLVVYKRVWVRVAVVGLMMLAQRLAPFFPIDIGKESVGAEECRVDFRQIKTRRERQRGAVNLFASDNENLAV